MSSLGSCIGVRSPDFSPGLGTTSALRQGVAMELGAVGAVFGH